MKYRLETFEVSERERRAIRWSMNGHRTPASRDECVEFAESAIRKALDEALEPYDRYMAILEAARDNGTV